MSVLLAVSVVEEGCLLCSDLRRRKKYQELPTVKLGRVAPCFNLNFRSISVSSYFWRKAFNSGSVYKPFCHS